jgi:hypothetical protein
MTTADFAPEDEFWWIAAQENKLTPFPRAYPENRHVVRLNLAEIAEITGNRRFPAWTSNL